MNIKKVVGRTEKEAVNKVKQLYGANALILNIQKKQSKGLLGFFVKSAFIVTAAFNPDDTKSITDDSLELLGDLDKYDIEKFEENLPSNQAKKLEKIESKKIESKKIEIEQIETEKIKLENSSLSKVTLSDDEKNKEAVMQAAANSLAIKALEQMSEPATPTKITHDLSKNKSEKNKNQLKLRPVPTEGHILKAYSSNMENAPQGSISSVDVDTQKESKERIAYLEKTLGDMQRKLMASEFETSTSRLFDNTVLQIFYEALVGQGVMEDAANDILTSIHNSVINDKTIDISYVAASVYTEILKTIKKPNPIVGGADAVFIFFAGPTGVGKTTTIAKIAGRLVLEQNIKVGLMTADTYRIAAVEQLKTYADILGLDVRVIYEKNDFIINAKEFGETKDVVFVDTAGRSHKNKENLLDLKDLINIPVVSEKYLVLSMTTKYEDLVNIINTYKDIGNFKLILTKFDETMHYGSIFNLCYTMGLEVVYITTGQNVPDDIELLKPEKIAKALLGLDTGL